MKRFIPRNKRDTIRVFRGFLLSELLSEAGYHCSNPLCDFNDLPLSAHHLIEHSQGGMTVLKNGLILCRRCHDLAHRGCLPLPLLISFKINLRQAKDFLFDDFVPLSSDELVNKVTEVPKGTASPNEKLTEINRLIIAANFLRDWRSRWLIFAEAMLAKASILTDNIREVKSSPEDAFRSLEWRRKRSCLLGTWAAYLACKIDAHAHFVRGLHFKAVGYRARQRYREAIQYHLAILNYLEAKVGKFPVTLHPYSTEGRIVRELAVNRTKIAHSKLAEYEVIKGLKLAIDRGDTHDILDAKIRCVETFVDLRKYSNAEIYLEQLYSDWNHLDANLKALTMKMHARMLISIGDRQSAYEIIDRGLTWSREHSLHHQEYQFWTLRYDFEKANFG